MKLQEKLLHIWTDILEQEVNLDSDFFDMGGNSLQAVRLTNLISEKFDLEVGIGELFENSTVRRMSELIGEKGIK